MTVVFCFPARHPCDAVGRRPGQAYQTGCEAGTVQRRSVHNAVACIAAGPGREDSCAGSLYNADRLFS